ncbi:MAG: (2Fe-2S) ferredoxin domain-containing protein, partial [Anaerolineae bacterium]|nr:(2Fe-2S) ferredoxin domain-containing protein [Anaerolineae bacterium]
MQLRQRRQTATTGWQQKIHAPIYITVGMSTCGIAAGARETLDAVEKELARRGMQAVVTPVGCVGMCSYEPMVEL